jgi:sugar fermentation stimulation protein A
MRFDSQLTPGRLLRRYKRFLADVELADGRQVTAHCPNTGSMLGCDRPGSAVWLSHSAAARRKYPWTWELVEADGVLVGIHTGRTNALVREALEAGRLDGLAGSLRAEVAYGREGSRADFLVEGPRGRVWVEVKNVTAAVSNGVALFPDAVTVRGRKHLRELQGMVAAGERAAMVFCVQRGDVHQVRPADAIDPAYGKALREAAAAGVELHAWRADVTPAGIELVTELPVVLD